MTEIGRRLKGFIIAVLITVAAMYILIALGSRSPRLSPEGIGTASVSVGSDGRLNNGISIIALALDEELVPDLAKAPPRTPGSMTGVSDRLIFVTTDTPVRVSEASIRGLRVRILAGPSKGRVGWVPSEWVKPSN